MKSTNIGANRYLYNYVILSWVFTTSGFELKIHVNIIEQLQLGVLMLLFHASLNNLLLQYFNNQIEPDLFNL